MKVKELDKTVNLAWSPGGQAPIMVVAGTAAQQLDASFSTSASLDIYDLNLAEPGLDMELKSSVQSQNRFHKVAWGACGGGAGVIVGGCDNGRLQMYNATRLLAGEEGLMCAPDRHTGHVKAVDFNPFQTNLLSSGASESEIFIWDLNNVKTPMTPGAKSQPTEEVAWLAWNRQVQHILASAFATRCVVWDLRKNEPIIKLSDSNSRVRWKVVAWHPDVATQLCLASEEDSNPVVQLWDLRFATTPIKTLEGHQKGVLSIAWCDQDPELMVSCGKDSRILCWNPTASQPGQEIVCEIETSNQWNFEVCWCPRNPSLIATSSFDGHASIFSLVGGQQQMPTTNKIADSFPGMEYAEAPVVQPPHHSHVQVDLRKAPKWFKRPVGASFAFGGKLVSFGGDSQTVTVSQVVTETGLVERSARLQQLLAAGQLREVCHSKSDPVWTFVAASLEPDYRTAMRTLLGFTQDQLELNKYIGQPGSGKLSDIDGLAEDFSVLSSQDGSDDEGRLSNNTSGLGSFSVVQNNTNLFNSINADENSYDNKKSPFKIKIGEDKEGVICRALLAGNVALAVDLCVTEGRMTDAIILAHVAGPDVLAKTQYKYFQQNKNYLSYLVGAVVSKDWTQVVSCCDLSSWAEALAAILIYASDDQLPTLCERLGDRLEREGGLDSRRNSEICFVAAGQLGHLIQNRISSDLSTEALQELVELVLVAQRGSVHGHDCAHLLDRYAQLLAAQGDLATALAYLTTSQDEDIEELRERLYVASGQKPYPATRAPQNAYYQNAGQPGYGSNYHKPERQRQSSLSYHQPPTPQYPTPAQPPSITPPRKPSISNSTFQPPGAPAPLAANAFASQTPSFPPPTSTSAFTPLQPSVPPPQSTMPPTAATNFFNPSAFTTPSTAQKPFQPPSAQPPPAQPPRTPVPFNSDGGVVNAPPNTFTHRSSPSPSLGGGTRNKYVVDPSVGGNNYSFRSPASTLMNNNPYAPQPYSQPTPAPAPQMFSQPPAPFSGTPQSYNQPGYNSLSSQPGYNSTSQAGYNSTAQPGYNSTAQPGYNNLSSQSQQGYGGFNNQPMPITNQPDHKPPPVFPTQPPLVPTAPGWNDPPAVSSSRKQPKEVHQPPPITHPLFAGGAPGVPMQAGPPLQANMGMQVNPPAFQPNMSMEGDYPAAAPPPVAPPAPVPLAPEPPRQKPPLPEEHMYLQTVFDELRNRCTCAANNPQLRRKLEDVSRKLEVLYDALRENKMSGGTVSSLHQLVQQVQGGDYTGALHLYTQLVSGPDFSQISAFMPGLKVLIQSALQLGVYLQ